MATYGTIYLLISMLITEFKQNYWKYFYKEKACIAPSSPPLPLINYMIINVL